MFGIEGTRSLLVIIRLATLEAAPYLALWIEYVCPYIVYDISMIILWCNDLQSCNLHSLVDPGMCRRAWVGAGGEGAQT